MSSVFSLSRFFRSPPLATTQVAPESGCLGEVRCLPANSGCLRWTGRVFVEPGGAVRLGYPGVRFVLRWRGPVPILRFDAIGDHNAFDCSINNWRPARLALRPGLHALEIPCGLAPADGWTLTLTRRNESWAGVATLRDLALPPGCELLPPPPRSSRRLLFVGDSITCGAALERLPGVEEPGALTGNAARAYGWLLAESLGAEAHLVAYSGRGIMRDWEGRAATNNLPEFFPLALPDDSAAFWDHAAYAPHAVVVCAGANDLNTGLPPAEEFEAAYLAFLSTVRSAHPRAALVLAECPMFSDTPGTKGALQRAYLRARLDALAARICAAPDAQAVRVASVPYFPGTVADPHPVAFQHEQIAAALAPAVRQVAGW